MSVPNPATTQWVPLQGKVPVTYLGQYQAGRTYYDGDAVIGTNGVLYLCCVDGTTTAPETWPGAGQTGPQGAVGPQGPQGIGVPAPVVNGQWVKGSGGAAVWSAIARGDVAPGVPLLASGVTANPPIQTTRTLIPDLTVTGTFLGGRPVIVAFRVGFQHNVVAFLDFEVYLDGVPITAGLGSDGVFGMQTLTSMSYAQQHSGTMILASVTAGSHTFALWGSSSSSGGNYFGGRRHLHVMEF